MAQLVKNLPAMGLIPELEDPLEKEMATHANILAWKIPWTEKLGGLQFMGLQKSQTRLSMHTWLNIKYFLDCLSFNRFHITSCPLLSRLVLKVTLLLI